MYQYEIMTDSAANLSDATLAQYDVTALSYHATIDGKEFACYERGRDHVAACKEYYSAMRAGAEVKTTMINVQAFIDAFEPVLQAGRDVLFIGMSSGLSGTFHAATLAAQELRADYPGRRCVAVDAMSASLGEGLNVCTAAQMRAEGKSLDEVLDWLIANRMTMHNEFTVTDLKYLRKGGRISSIVALAGTLLNIKPLLAASRQGTIVMLGKERGEKKALIQLAERLADQIVDPEHQTIGIAHCDNEMGANFLAEQIRARVNVGGIMMEYYDLCTGGHVGPGTVALFYRGCPRTLNDHTAEIKEHTATEIKDFVKDCSKGE
jgi:DegV family protein with EDD domain